MANWKDIPASTYSKYYQANGGEYDSVVNGDVYITLQYDADTVTPTSAELRFKLNNVGGADYWDMYYVLLNPEETYRTIHPLKTIYTKKITDSTARAKWPYYSSTTFTVTKSYTAKTFNIPSLWLINDGWDNTSPDTAAEFYANYKKGGKRGVTLRAAFYYASIEIASSTTVADPIEKGKVSIKDNYNNSFTITGAPADSANNNDVTGYEIYWGYSATGRTNLLSLNDNTIKFTPSPVESATKAVYATTITYSEYNNTFAEDYAEIKQYVAPNNPGTPVLAPLSKSRPTVKESWTYKWAAATGKNTSSPVVGYNINLYRSRKNDSGTYTEVVIKTQDIKSINSFTFNPAQLDILPGDRIRLGIKAFTRTGKDNTGNTKYSSSEIKSSYTVVQNAGIVRIKVANTGSDNDWREGQVWVKATNNGDNNDWKEAEVIKVKVSNDTDVNKAWKESE